MKAEDVWSKRLWSFLNVVSDVNKSQWQAQNFVLWCPSTNHLFFSSSQNSSVRFDSVGPESDPLLGKPLSPGLCLNYLLFSSVQNRIGYHYSLGSPRSSVSSARSDIAGLQCPVLARISQIVGVQCFLGSSWCPVLGFSRLQSFLGSIWPSLLVRI